MSTKTTVWGRGAGTQAFDTQQMGHGNKTLFGFFGAERKQKIISTVQRLGSNKICMLTHTGVFVHQHSPNNNTIFITKGAPSKSSAGMAKLDVH
jgi:hypothetical protein